MHPSSDITDEPIELDLTVVVPTRNERDNVAMVVARLGVTGVPRVMFVDDSDDGTAAAIEATALSCDMKVEVVHRMAGDRTGGLSGAVVRGLETSGSMWTAVMDGDLQHPPEVVRQLADTAQRSGADLVIATRHNWDSINEGLSWWRRGLSFMAGRAAFAALPRELRPVSDPLSGFFLVRTAAIDLDLLEPDGFKILMEIVATHPELRVAEVPFHFAHRVAGESKGTVAEGIRYARHLRGLRRRVKARTPR